MTAWPPADADAPFHGLLLAALLSLPVWAVVVWVVV
jgi:hypothetical protein